MEELSEVPGREKAGGRLCASEAKRLAHFSHLFFLGLSPETREEQLAWGRGMRLRTGRVCLELEFAER